MRLHHAHAGPRRPRPVRPRPDVHRPRPRARRLHRALRLSAQRPAQHDLPGAALLALRQRRGHAARQGLAAACSPSTTSTPSPTASTRPPGSPTPCRSCFDTEIPEWRHDNQYFRSVYGDRASEIETATRSASSGSLPRSKARRASVQPEHAHPRLRPPRRHLQARQLLFHDPKRLLASRQKASAACRSSSPAKPIPPTTPARRSSAMSSTPPPSFKASEAPHPLPRKLRLGPRPPCSPRASTSG